MNKFLPIPPRQYNEWLENEVTEAFFEFLIDFCEEARKEKMPTFNAESLDDLVRIGTLVTVVNTTTGVLEDVVSVGFVDIMQFYNPDYTPPNEENQEHDSDDANE